ncbi:Hypothetical protein DHA2_153292 [Giardia duodenalis]|uniref:RING-type domain-containing protein n=1 Tax=Giardia intestinalis TaxID=5741 RepID=V6TFL0_GIAIN|nr:Hypothetical protein DHA2_153292 [Giardia intestinalis]
MEPQNILFKAVEENDLDLIVQHAAQYAGTRDADGYTALHRAILSRKLECTVILAPYERAYLTPAGISPMFLAESIGFLQAIDCLRDPPRKVRAIKDEDDKDLSLQIGTNLDYQLALLAELLDTKAELEQVRNWNAKLQQNVIQQNRTYLEKSTASNHTTNQSFTNIDTCVICLDRPREIVYLPCRHFIVCEQCFIASQLRTCPLCRSPIVEAVAVLR